MAFYTVHECTNDVGRRGFEVRDPQGRVMAGLFRFDSDAERRAAELNSLRAVARQENEMQPLTPAMLRELSHIARYGEPCDMAEFHGANNLAFHAREKVLSALIRRGLISDAETITDAGRVAIARATERPPHDTQRA